MCSSEKLPKGSAISRYRVKCLVCESHNSAWVKDYEGTNPFSYHAEHVHPKEPKVAEWLHQISVAADHQEEEKKASEQNLGKVCFACIPLFQFVVLTAF